MDHQRHGAVVTIQQALLMAVAPTFATWNPADKNASISLAGGNLVATTAAAGEVAVRGTISKSSGKWFWEVTVTGGSYGVYGVADSAHVLNLAPGEDAAHAGWGYLSSSGTYHNGAFTAYGASYTTGDVIGIGLDLDAGSITFYKNGVSQGVAYTGVSGTLFPMSSMGAGRGSGATINFGASSFAFPVSGYGVITA